MTLKVRAYRPSDALAVSEVRRAAAPHLISTPQGVAWSVTSAAAAQRFALFVAVLDGRIVGAAQAGLAHDSSTPGQAFAHLHVHPGHRERGAGRALLAAAEIHLADAGATHVYSWVHDAPAARDFATHHGYRPTRPAHFLRLDLTAAALPPRPERLPRGVELRTGADFDAEPQALYAADAEVVRDEPGDIAADAMTYEDWLAHTWEHPDMDLDLTSVVTVDGRIAAFSLAKTDGRGRYTSAMTGTLRAFRGRGLAKLAKADSLHRARESGCTQAFTGNDAANAPMLAINEQFGYRPFARQWRYVREVTAGGSKT